MDIDIGFWLTLAVLVSGLIWLADRKWRLREHEQKAVRETVEFSNSLLPVFIIVLVIRSFLAEPFKIPSGSMLPTLEVNDFILVNKFSYGLRLPVTNTLVLPLGEPERGDVMVFRYPVDTSQNFIKRVVGVPGDRIHIRDDGRLYVNDRLVERELRTEQDFGNVREAVYVEALNDTHHMIRHEMRVNPYTGEAVSRTPGGTWEVPEGKYFTVGDNRDRSSDSRTWGMVPEEYIVGEAFLIWMHWESLFSLPSFARNGPIDRVEEKE